MLVVMDQGYASKPGASGNLFGDVVLKDLIALVDSTYRTLPDREHRAMAGLSMGGAQTLQITLANLDRFSYIGAFSAPVRNFDANTSYGGVFRDPEAINKRVHLLWLGAGTAEPGIHQPTKAFHEALDRVGVQNVFVETPGLAHEWQTWRKALYDFASRLFPEAKEKSDKPHTAD
jgi:enterochelin esterase-like enzyme